MLGQEPPREITLTERALERLNEIEAHEIISGDVIMRCGLREALMARLYREREREALRAR